MTDICVQPHKQDHTALPALRLCTGCYYGLRGAIKALPRLHAQLGTALATGSSPSTGGRVTGSSSEPLPINPAVANHRDQIKHDLTWWTIHVADERGFRLPADDLREITAWLLRQVDWIAASLPAAEECPPVMMGLAGKARALIDPNRKLKTGERCRLDDDHGDRCGGTVAMVQKPDETWIAHCSECGPQEAAPYLRDTVAGRWVTLERVRAYALRAHGLHVERATIRSWAARGRVQTRNAGTATWYDLGSVHRYLAERERVRPPA